MKENSYLYYTLVSILLISAGLFFYQPYGIKEITINDNGEIFTTESSVSHVADLLQEQEITLAPGDRLLPPNNPLLEEGMVVEINRAAAVKLVKPEGQKTHYTQQKTVGQLMTELSLSPENCLLVSPSLNAPVYSGMEIILVPYTVAMEIFQEQIPYEVEFKEDNSLDEGRRVVLQEGQEGIRELTYRVYYAEDKEIYRELAKETVAVEPADAVVALGTNPRSTLTIASREKTAMAYTEEGIASWYGAKFQGNRTTSGEIYDKNQYTAAHLTLPFNTLVRVTFLRTGKDVVVRINDRGPHVRGRIIDLSRAAAEEIGLRPHGVGKVRIEVVGRGR